MTDKLGKVEIYSKEPPSMEFFDALSTRLSDHVIDKKGYILTSARPLVTKADIVMGSNAPLLSAKSRNPLITWSHKVI